MTGAQIKEGVSYIKTKYGGKGCGSVYFDNGCQVTVNSCNFCGTYDETHPHGPYTWQEFEPPQLYASR